MLLLTRVASTGATGVPSPGVPEPDVLVPDASGTPALSSAATTASVLAREWWLVLVLRDGAKGGVSRRGVLPPFIPLLLGVPCRRPATVNDEEDVGAM